MITLEQVCIRPETAAYLLNLAIAVSLASGVGLVATILCRRCSAPLRHGILLSSLSLALISPVLVGLAAQARLGMIAVTVWEPQGLDQTKRLELTRVPPSTRPENDPMVTSPSPVTSIGQSSFDVGPADPAEDAFQGLAVSEEAPSEQTTDRAMPQAGRVSSTPSWWEIAGTLWLCVWTLGVVVRAAALGRGWLSVVRLRRSFEQSHELGLRRTVLAAARNLGLRQAPAVFTSPSVTVPLSLGLLRPVLVLPRGIERETAGEAIRALLLHELAHIARADRWVGLAQRIAAALYWWNPLIHRVNDCLSDLREEICDSHVLRVQGNGRWLAELLVEMASRARPGAQIPCGLGVLRPRGDGLCGRITRILDKETNTMTRMNLSSIAIVVAFGAALAGVLLATGVRAEQGARPAPERRIVTVPKGTEAADDEDAGSGTPREPAASVRLLHRRKEFFVGEPVEIQYCLTNVGTEPLPIEFGGDYRGTGRHERFKVTAVDANGKEVPDALMRAQNMGGRMTGRKLEPGQQYVQALELHKYRRLVDPGRYTVRVVHDLGWDPEVRRPPVGETTITLKLPNREEARVVITKSPDLGILRHPVYLPVLSELVREGNRKAFAGFAGIQTLESTKALLGLVEEGLGKNDLDLALAAYGGLGDRLPNPRFYQSNYGDWYEPERALLKLVWRPEFADPLRRLASRLARDPQPKALGTISFIFECVGKAEDMPDLILGYTKSIEATKTLPFETHQYFRPRGSAYGYRFSTRQLLSRGAKVPTDPQTPGAAAVYLIAMQARGEFRPADWPSQVVRWLRYETPYMREFVLDHMPEPIPEAALRMLPELLADDYVDLQIAACHTAKKHPREAFRGPIRTILRTETEEHLLNAATGAGPPSGITNDQIMEIWLDRLDSDDLGSKAVIRLLLSVLDDNQARSPREIDAEAVETTRKRWRRFIKEHREELRQGRRFKLGDPEITPDLFPPGFQFYFDGKPWPAN